MIVAFPFIYVVLVNALMGKFVLLALALAFVMIPGAFMVALPKTTLFGFAFTVNFFAAVAPLNPMDYNVVHFLNNTIWPWSPAWLFGSLAYILILPPDLKETPHHYVRYRKFVAPSRFSPCTNHRHRRHRLENPHVRPGPTGSTFRPRRSGPSATSGWNRGLRALHFGNGILRLRDMLATGKLSQEAAVMVQSILDALGWFTEFPQVSLSIYPGQRRRLSST